jgi:hypothetical protein
VALTEGSEEQLDFGKLRKAEDSALLAEGFEPGGGDLWRRDGTYFGRDAALQNVHIVYLSTYRLDNSTLPSLDNSHDCQKSQGEQ